MASTPLGLMNFQPGQQPTRLERLAGRRIRSDKHEDTGFLSRAVHALGPVNARAPLLIADPPRDQMPPRRYGK